ncbi:protein phosphatase 2C domain-containing protein [Halomonas llamarensis]|uniref:Protein phosphatase 2C domain-containing protein n=1 Tax=Halomonas llamarensis TaxID=2945104 RepID=A0ABT0SPN8_9GAMM|nr:protein phosphatase 2C domain-containing protein [Halomonas llamarensis]
MKHSQDYYRRVINSLFGVPGQRVKDHVMDQVLNETEAAALIDEFYDRFNDVMLVHFNQAKEDGTKAKEAGHASTPGLPICNSEECEVSEHHNANSGNAPQDRSADAPIQPGDIPSEAPAEAPVPIVASRAESLPNGRSGQPYDVCLDELLDDLPAKLQLEDDGGSNLSLSDDRRLQGTPTAQGAHQLEVQGLDEQGETILQLTLKLALIPSSRDLWKNLPSDPDVPYAKPDEEVDRLSGGDGWQMAMGSQRGRSHAHRGGQRDDHGTIARATTGWNVLIVGDGAGSCDYARQGSLLATTVARDKLLSSLAANEGAALEAAALAWWKGGDRSRMSQALLVPLQQTMITAVHAGHRAIAEEAKASGHPAKAFSTTLLLALHKETPDGHIVVTFGIGDGAVAALYEDRQAQMLNTADSGQHAGQTRFLDAPLFQEAEGLYQRVKINVFSSLEALIVATDGLTDPKFTSDNDMHDGESWWTLYDELAPALSAPNDDSERDPLQDYLSFFVERHHDDRTLAVLYRDSVASAVMGGAEITA